MLIATILTGNAHSVCLQNDKADYFGELIVEKAEEAVRKVWWKFLFSESTLSKLCLQAFVLIATILTGNAHSVCLQNDKADYFGELIVEKAEEAVRKVWWKFMYRFLSKLL